MDIYSFVAGIFATISAICIIIVAIAVIAVFNTNKNIKENKGDNNNG